MLEIWLVPRKSEWGVWVLSAYQMGSRTAMTNGLLRFIFSISRRLAFWSYRLHHRSSFVSLRLRAAFFCKMIGPYVSFIRQAKAKATPESIKAIQFIHRQPRYCVTKPPRIGPKTAVESVTKVDKPCGEETTYLVR